MSMDELSLIPGLRVFEVTPVEAGATVTGAETGRHDSGNHGI
jgi:hypothetical protein